MAKNTRKKYPKLPNGFGTIKYLGAGRKNPYAVHPSYQGLNEMGAPILPKALCYVPTWYTGFAVLTAYNAGTYTPGMEQELTPDEANIEVYDKLVRQIVANYALITSKTTGKTPGKTFAQVYDEFFSFKYETDKKRTYSQNTINCTKAAFKHLSCLHDKSFHELRFQDLQSALDKSTYRHASIEHMLSLLHQMYSFAEDREYVEKDYSSHLKINVPDDDEHGVPFSEEEIKKLWDHKNEPTAEMLLIMIYSGFRISAYLTLEVNLSEKYFKGGVKTKASINRIVPIHSSIFPLVQNRLKRDGKLLLSKGIFRSEMKNLLSSLNISAHTPHDCRHTFSALCEKYKVHENDRKRMLGHNFENDLTNSVYGHRSLEDLRIEIEKIKTPKI